MRRFLLSLMTSCKKRLPTQSLETTWGVSQELQLEADWQIAASKGRSLRSSFVECEFERGKLELKLVFE